MSMRRNRTAFMAVPSPMQWWRRKTMAAPPATFSTRWMFHSGLEKSSGVLARSLMRRCSSTMSPGAGRATRWMCASRSKLGSTSQWGVPTGRADSTTRMVNRSRVSRRTSNVLRKRSKSSGLSSRETPVIIIRLVDSSMCSQAESTGDICFVLVVIGAPSFARAERSRDDFSWRPPSLVGFRSRALLMHRACQSRSAGFRWPQRTVPENSAFRRQGSAMDA